MKSLLTTAIFIMLLAALVIRLSASMNQRVLYAFKVTCAILGLIAVLRNFSQTTVLVDKVTMNLVPKAANALNIASDRFFKYISSTAERVNDKTGNILDDASSGGK